MSTRPDFIISGGKWYDIYDELNITPETEIIIQNKGVPELLINYDNSPVDASNEGFMLLHGLAIKTSEPKVWVKTVYSAGTVYIEEVE